ncbi:DNA mismatch repair protein MLH3-like isoform X1 [Selaginella moellendorffii]|uniref:DNA mismatch repair protein MLH3-like isoform X1 n=1 Tax=Selaginella moellendorffii TaxID=88036 RepID=UPI000D1C46BE|nr:DNA mismatch repair protein MLH3-like isoform X1 [Selaginella moellendorffii]|eukprot:XP_024544458.1 DNA mismatch repair protein MLH3-like isoform X1 [Selaginella moellendorffii]
MARISPLPQTVASCLRSSSILSGISQVVDELVCNAIDAQATQIIVFLDIRSCYIKVEDDGCGISREDFVFLGERHATSKLHRLDELETGLQTLGFRGEGLSSVSDIGLVEVTSRAKVSPHTYRKIFKNCKSLSLGLPGNQRDPGTTVVVKDAFYNQPVRKKILHRNSRKAVESVKNHILRLCLVHPKIQFTLVDLEREEKVFQAKPARSLSSRISDMFGDETRNTLQKIDFAKGSLRLAGYISKHLKSFSTKALQFLYINRRFVVKTPLHKVLNSWPSTQIGCPSFVLNLVCPHVDYDITLDASKSLVVFKDWSPVLSFVEEILKQLWEVECHIGTSRKPKAKRKRGAGLIRGAETFSELPASDLDGTKASRTVVNTWRSSSAPPFYKPRKKFATHKSFDDISVTYEAPRKNKILKLDTLDYQDRKLCKWRQILLRPRQNTFTTIERPILQIGSGTLSSGDFQPDSITKEMLSGAKVLGQVDRKFIAAITNGVLFFIDQHAADERVRLEEFRDDIFSTKEGHGTSLGDQSEEVILTRSEQEALVSYREKIEYWGWRSTFVFSQGRSSEICKVVLAAVPCIKGVKLTSKDLLEYLRQLVDTHGSSSAPPAVLRVLNFKACRGAIMFGDFLLPSECEQLVNALKKTSLCFQCAHGRPTMVPIVNLETIRTHQWQSPKKDFSFSVNKALFSTRKF